MLCTKIGIKNSLHLHLKYKLDICTKYLNEKIFLKKW